MGTRVFITGVAGQDGSLLAESLLADGAEVHGLVLPGQTHPGDVILHEGDLGAGIAPIIDRVRPDVVFNLGGISSVGFSWENPALTGLVSGQGAVGVFDAAWKLQENSGKRVSVIQASSAEVFGSPTVVPQNERTPLAPVSPYGAAKAYAQNVGRAYRAKGLGLTTVILYPHESTRRPEGFVTRKITSTVARIAANGGGELRLGNMAAVRDWGWAPDYVQAMRLAADQLQAGFDGAEYVVATGVGHTVEQFVAAAFAAVGIDDWRNHVTVDPDLFRPVDPAQLIGDASRIRAELGWEPTVDFAELVRRMCVHDLELLG